jgi:hypothetical protein
MRRKWIIASFLVGALLHCFVVDSLHISSSSIGSSSSKRRRDVLQTTALVGSTLLLPATAAHAVAPIAQVETETGIMKAMRLLRPKPQQILRPPIARDFAVLLLRSSHATTDFLDIVAMNQFQRDFFLIRSAEYEPYLEQLRGYVKQGDVTDANYFDFISFAQYLTINRVLSDPAVIFEEMQPIQDDDSKDDAPQRFQSVVVRRTLRNDQLVPSFDAKLGSAILQHLQDTYQGTPSALPSLYFQRPGIDAVHSALSQLVKLFLLNGFAWDGRVEVVLPKAKTTEDAAGTTFVLTLVSPASLWGNQCLHRQRSQLCNDYLLKTAMQLIQRLGYESAASSSVQFKDNCEVSYLTLC